MLFLLLSFLQQQNIPTAIVVFTVASFVPAYASYALVEVPMRELGHRPAPVPRQPVESVGAPAARRGGTEWRRARPAWAGVLTGSAILTVVAVVPAYAARHEIVARDEAAARFKKPTTTITTAAVPAPAGQAAADDAPASTPAPRPVVSAAPPLASPSASGPVESEPVGTKLVVDGPASLTPTLGGTRVEVVLGARLTSTEGVPLAGRLIHLSTGMGAGSCDAITASDGHATCTLALERTALSTTLVTLLEASFAGDALARAASASWP
jgi:hypothetical protein